ncbi:MAG: conjugal transfer protein TraG N-terminal domain-containing protein [Pseudomonadota bacterium]
MDWLVFGDLAFLADIVNGVAAIMGNVGTGTANDYTGLLATVMLLGVLALAGQAILQARGIQFHHLLVVLLVWGVLFVPKTTVTMENVYTGQTRTVANVPLGIAFTGSLLSRIGYALTDMTETAFSYPGITEDGFASALETWSILRRAASFPDTYAAASEAAGGDFRRSWVMYVSTCTSFGLDMGAIQRTALSSAILVHEALKFENAAFGTFNHIGAGSNEDCVEGHTELVQWSHTSFIPALKAQVLADLFHDPARAIAPTEAVVNERVGELFEIFGLPPGVSTDEALLSLFVGPLVDMGAMRRLQLDMKEGFAVALADAIRQRNAQWIAQGNIFESYTRPLISFVEGFFYAMAPIVLVAAVMGFSGFRIVSRYVLIGLWIQFWAPTLAFINLYILHSLASDIASLDGAGLPFTSLGGQFSADDEVQKQLAVAGLFASSVPILSLLLITGSVYSFNTIAARAGGPDTFDERVPAPSSIAKQPLLMVESPMRETPVAGFHVNGAQSVLPRFTFSAANTESVTAAERAMQSERLQFSQALDRALSSSRGSETRSTSGTLWTDSERAENSEVYGLLQNEAFSRAYRVARGSSENDVEAMSRLATAGANMGASRGTGGPSRGGTRSAGVNAGIDGRHESTERFVSSDDRNVSNEMQRAFQENEGLQSAFQMAFARDIQRGLTQSGFNSSAFTETEALRREASEAVGAERSYEKALTRSETGGFSQEMGLVEAANLVVESGAYKKLKYELMENGYANRADWWSDRYTHDMGVFTSAPGQIQRSYAAGGLTALREAGDYRLLNEILGSVGLQAGPAGDPRASRIEIPEIGIARDFGGRERGVGGADLSMGAAPVDNAGEMRTPRSVYEARRAELGETQGGREERFIRDRDFAAEIRAVDGHGDRGLLDDALDGYNRVKATILGSVTGPESEADRRQAYWRAVIEGGGSTTAGDYFAELMEKPGQQNDRMYALEDQIRQEFGNRDSLAASVIYDLKRAASGRTTNVESILSDVGMRYDERREWPQTDEFRPRTGDGGSDDPPTGEPLRLNVYGTSDDARR